MASPHPLISELSMVRALWSANAPPDWKLPTVLDGASMPNCANKGKKWFNQCLPRLFYSQGGQPPRILPHKFPHPTFMLAPNRPSKRFALTDNMWPKSDAKRHHWWLKGKLKTHIVMSPLYSHTILSPLALATAYFPAVMDTLLSLISHILCKLWGGSEGAMQNMIFGAGLSFIITLPNYKIQIMYICS